VHQFDLRRCQVADLFSSNMKVGFPENKKIKNVTATFENPTYNVSTQWAKSLSNSNLTICYKIKVTLKPNNSTSETRFK
jgi:hypothetical protein